MPTDGKVITFSTEPEEGGESFAGQELTDLLPGLQTAAGLGSRETDIEEIMHSNRPVVLFCDRKSP
jgi:hypothetical protein